MDTAAAKIVIQRFDPRFAERSTQDQRHTFGGYEPAAADRSRERQRKALVDRAETSPVVQGVTREALPEPALQPNSPDCTRATAHVHNPASRAITGVGQVYAGLARALQAQSEHDDHHPGTPTPAGNDKTLDSEAGTQQDPGGRV